MEYLLKKDEDHIIELDEAKHIELDVLLKFKEICNKYSLKYSLAYGTLLGSIRHKGFIPWDDDIDVMMLREDYFRFIEVSRKELEGTKYEVASMHNDLNYFAPLSKLFDNSTRVYQFYGQNENIIVGVYIDIFILDQLPEENAEAFYENAQKLRGNWAMSARNIFTKHQSKNVFRDILGNIAALPYKIRGNDYYRNKYDAYCSQFNDNNGTDVAVVVYGEGLKKERISISEMFIPNAVDFEKYQFMAVSHPEKYLKSMYGDYMQLPPVEARVSKHPNIMVKLKDK